MGVFRLAVFFGLVLNSQGILADEKNRESKLLPIFQVVRFPNDICSGSSRNGTCYTAEECSSRGGTNGGTCASGFGICCIFELSCGSTTSDNVSYLVQTASSSVDSPCTYKVCPCSNNICRIRYDFTTFVTATQVTGTAAATNAQATGTGTQIGSCLTDSFSIASPGLGGSPLICGTNSGYHMVIDAAQTCQTAAFQIAPSTTTTRQWDIKVTQYACGDDDKGGPPGCLQYYTGTTGSIANFGFPSTITGTATASVTHLKNQKYQACFRREKSYCYICYTPTDPATPASFGLSISPSSTAAQARVGSLCTTDYIVIPSAQLTTSVTTTSTTTSGIWKICGRFLASANAATASVTVCSRQYPFTLGVHFNDDEEDNAPIAEADTNELDVIPGGIIGFKLYWFQGSC